MTPSFDVHVPFEAVVQESLEARTQSALPDAELSSGLRVRRTASGYEAELRVTASHPREAKVAAVQRVETLLKLLAAGNDGFRVVISGIREVRAIDVDAPATAEHTAERLSDTVFLEEHLGVLKQKGDLAPEDAVLERLDDLPPSVRNCLDLNYLLVISDRPPVRWLLAATGLEALAVGRLGNQPRLSGLLSARRKRGLQASIDRALREAGVEDADKRARALERLLGATQERLAAHVVRYLELMGIHDVTVDEIANWWTIRGRYRTAPACRSTSPTSTASCTAFRPPLAVRPALSPCRAGSPRAGDAGRGVSSGPARVGPTRLHRSLALTSRRRPAAGATRLGAPPAEG